MDAASRFRVFGTARPPGVIGGRYRRRVSRRRAVAAGIAAVVVVVPVVLVGPLVLLEVDEAAVPPVSAGHLPETVAVVGQEKECGSAAAGGN